MQKEKDIMVQNDIKQSKEESSKIALFEDDQHFLLFHKKTEKLVSAIYMLTTFFSDDEPLKWSLRGLGVKVLSFTIALKDIFSFKRKDVINDVKANIFETLSLLEVAFFAGIISEMNLLIFKKEFKVLAGLLDKDILPQQEKSALVIPENFFTVAPTPENQAEKSPLGKSKTSFSVSPVLGGSESKGHFSKGSNVLNRKSARKNAIMSLLKEKGEISIKDIAGIMKSASKKTLQRELLFMLGAGIIKKDGERRWSKYRLV